MSWWYNLTMSEQILYIVASISSALLLLDLFYFVSGIKKQNRVKKESLISCIFRLRSFLILTSVGCWSVIVSYKALGDFLPATIIGFAFGLLIVIVFALCIRYVLSLRVLPDIALTDLINCEGVAYSLIPPKGEGRGKISIIVDGKMRVFEAVAYEDNKIQTGNDIKVIDALGENLLLVERIKEVI